MPDPAFAAWWRASYGYTPQDYLEPSPYAVKLAASGLRPSPERPTWAVAEALGRERLARFLDRGTLPGQMPGTWAEEVESALHNGVTSYTVALIAARGPLPLVEGARWIVYGAYSFPDEAQRLIAALPAGNGAGPVADGEADRLRARVAGLEATLAAIRAALADTDQAVR